MTAAFISLSKSSTELGVKNSILVLKQFVVIRYYRAIAGESISEARKVLLAQKERTLQDILQQAMRYTLSSFESFVLGSVFVFLSKLPSPGERGCL